MKPQSIKSLLSSLHTISSTAGFEIPQKQFPLVNITLHGLGNLKQTPPEQAHPVTVQILLQIRENLNLNHLFYGTMWVLFVSCFCMLLHKSNVTPNTGKDWETQHMCREHLKRGPVGYLVTLYWTKSLQIGDRRLEYPLLEAFGCLAWKSAPAFCHSDGNLVKYSTFNNFIKSQVHKLGSPSLVGQHTASDVVVQSI